MTNKEVATRIFDELVGGVRQYQDLMRRLHDRLRPGAPVSTPQPEPPAHS